MLTIIYNDYTITVKPDSCTVKQSYKNKNLRVVQRVIGHMRDVPSAIKKIAEHELHNNNRTIELKQYLKEYRETVDKFWKLIS